jgi:hypothetical protein
MSDWIALLATVGVVVSILVGRVFYLRGVRQGRADPEHRDQSVLRPR